MESCEYVSCEPILPSAIAFAMKTDEENLHEHGKHLGV
jgi:hypothetical protein